jgi:hypothetical protein
VIVACPRRGGAVAGNVAGQVLVALPVAPALEGAAWEPGYRAAPASTSDTAGNPEDRTVSMVPTMVSKAI